MGFTLSDTYVLMTVSINNCTNRDFINQKCRENMEIMEMSKEEIMKNAMDDFEKFKDA